MILDDERNTLRSALRARRRQLTAAERIEAAAGVARSLEQLPEFLTDARIAGYWAIDGELPLHSTVASLRSRHQQFHLPCITGTRQLRFAPWRPGIALEPNRYGIPEPAGVDDEQIDAAELDVVLLPMLGFDRRGSRLGYGGGYYDSTLAFLRERDNVARPVLVGVAYAVQQLDSIERAEWDVPLDYVATEVELIDCWQERGEDSSGAVE
jgi:5-formyltetrahydrofolate cyclo-ligase